MNSPPRKYSEKGLYAPVWKELNRILRYIQEIAPTTGHGVDVKRTMNGSLIRSTKRADAEPGSVLNQYILKEILGDYLRCRTYDDGGEGGVDIFIAKPFRLRQTPFDGETITFDSDGDSYVASYSYLSSTNRMVTIGGVQERQIVVPTWKTDFDIIYAMEVVEPTGVEDEDENPITLLDINADGRAFARAFNQ